MFDPALTPASLAGALAYLATAVLAFRVPQGGRGPRIDSPGRWRLVALVFVALALWRLSAGEIRLQNDARTWARDHGVYDERAGLQSVFTVMVMIGAAAGVTWAALKGMPDRSMTALGATFSLVLLSLGRLASLHALDELLYRTGPIHLNYLIDMGLTAWTASLAWLESLAAGQPKPMRPSQRRSRS